MRRLALAMLLSIAALPAQAQLFLYDPNPPAGSAYVRIINALDAPLAITSNFGPGMTLPSGTSDRVGPYRAVEQVATRTLRLEAADIVAQFSVTPGSFTSVVVTRDGDHAVARPITEETAFNQARVRLSFVNATGSCAGGRLELLPDGPAIFSDVAPGQSRMRNVNPVTARLRASCATLPAVELELGAMDVGGQYSIWLMSPNAQPLAFVARDVMAPYRP